MDMWIGDLAQAIQAVRQFKNYKNFCIKSAVPAVDGIVFETTYFTYIKWYRIDGYVEEHGKDEWRKKGKQMKCVECSYWWKEEWEEHPSCHCNDFPAPCEEEDLEEPELDEED